MDIQYYLIVVCSNCQRVLGKKKTSLVEDDGTKSHSVCPECVEVEYRDDFDPEELSEIVKTAARAVAKLIKCD